MITALYYDDSRANYSGNVTVFIYTINYGLTPPSSVGDRTISTDIVALPELPSYFIYLFIYLFSRVKTFVQVVYLADLIAAGIETEPPWWNE